MIGKLFIFSKDAPELSLLYGNILEYNAEKEDEADSKIFKNLTIALIFYFIEIELSKFLFKECLFENICNRSYILTPMAY